MQADGGRLAQLENVLGSCEFPPSPCPGEERESARSENFGAEPFTSQPLKRSEAVSSLAYRVSRRTLGLVIAAVIGLTALAKVPEIPRVEAVVNARVITLQAPIGGEVRAGPVRLDVGTSIARGDLLLRVANRGADHSRVDDLTGQIDQLAEERLGIANRLGNAHALLKDLADQTHLFVEARIMQLEARQDARLRPSGGNGNRQRGRLQPSPGRLVGAISAPGRPRRSSRNGCPTACCFARQPRHPAFCAGARKLSCHGCRPEAG